ncbi:MAG TPA: hypothetical protein VLA13_10035 [Massilibacterium sp.]|nr:hypothetical protein [Massilibacterium sp.]
MRYQMCEGIDEANKAEKEEDMQGVRNSAVGLRHVIEAVNDKHGIDMTEEIIEYLRSEK